jgi:hypothetical protein
MHDAEWLFPIRGPNRRVFVCGVKVKATPLDAGDVDE